MTKTIALPLIAALALGAAACSKKADENTAVNAEASADLNAAAGDAMADVNAAAGSAMDNGAMAMDNAADMNAAGANTTNAM